MKLLKNKFVISISYGDYVGGKGGTDKVLVSHSKRLDELGIAMIHLFPYTVNKNPKFSLWGIREAGKVYGPFTTNHLLQWLFRLQEGNKQLLACYIHHLKDIDIISLDRLIKNISSPIIMYIHDFQTICPSSGLVKNDESYCGIGFPCESKCKDCCKYSIKIEDRVQQIRNFIGKISNRLTYIIPSEEAAKIWKEHYKEYEDQVRIIYHQKLVGQYHANLEQIHDDMPLKLAFVGYKMNLKGWPQWYEAAKRIYNEKKNIKLFQFGRTDIHCDFITEVTVDFNSNLNAMIAALRQYNIDCVILWSQVPETYSYTFYESFASNAFILTCSLSGNIQYQVLKNENGYVATNNESLADILLDEKNLRIMINDFRHKKIYGPELLREDTKILDELSKYEVSYIKGLIEKRSLHECICEYAYYLKKRFEKIKLFIKIVLNKISG